MEPTTLGGMPVAIAKRHYSNDLPDDEPALSQEFLAAVRFPGRGNIKYPFRELEVGQSFRVEYSRIATLHGLANVWGKKLGRKFSVRKMPGGWARVTRIS